MSPVTPVSVDRTTLFYGTYVPESDPMDLMQCVVDIALVGLMSLTVIGVIAMTVLAAKAAKDGSHGCGPVAEEESEEEKVTEEEKEKQRKLMEEYYLSLWEKGYCKYCRKQKEIFTPNQQCAGCFWSDEYGPGF